MISGWGPPRALLWRNGEDRRWGKFKVPKQQPSRQRGNAHKDAPEWGSGNTVGKVVRIKVEGREDLQL